MRVAAIGDLHCRTTSQGEMRRLLDGVDDQAEVLLLAGDLTNLGLTEEMQVLLDDLGHLQVPKIAVTGNHDHEMDQSERLVAMMREAGVTVLDADVVEVGGVGFAGTKGFCGGFDGQRLQPFGERLIKDFIHASVREVERFEQALAALDAPRRVALLHYSPISATLHGEHPEIYPFLGFSLLAEALDRHGVDVAVHGHSHYGSLEGITPGGIPVHNVSHYVRRRHGKSAYAVFDV